MIDTVLGPHNPPLNLIQSDPITREGQKLALFKNRHHRCAFIENPISIILPSLYNVHYKKNKLHTVKWNINAHCAP